MSTNTVGFVVWKANDISMAKAGMTLKCAGAREGKNEGR